jgi:putative holliday junction resolvase
VLDLNAANSFAKEVKSLPNFPRHRPGWLAQPKQDSVSHIIGNVIPQVARPSHKRGPDIDNSSKDKPTGRILGLDVGARRIGIAVSDPLGITAQGLDTLQRRNKRTDLAALERVIREYSIKQIVVGLPLRMSGAEGIQSDKMQLFAEDLRKRFRLPVHLWDERLTSAEANRLLRETELSIEKRAKAVDRMAAVLILQGWMEGRRR